MAQNEYYPEDVLVGKMQSGEYGWLDYVNHFSADWQEEYARYCEEKTGFKPMLHLTMQGIG